MAKIIFSIIRPQAYDVNTQHYYNDGTIDDTFENGTSQQWIWKVKDGIIVFQSVSSLYPEVWHVDGNDVQTKYQQYLSNLITSNQ